MTSQKGLINTRQQTVDTTENSESNDSDADSDNSIELEFNLEALKESAERVFGKSCVLIKKLSEGGYHKVFVLKMSDDKEYVGRVAFPECPHLKLECEIAVMKYVHENIKKIKVPEVYHYESKKDNPVGQEYIIMEYIPGDVLSNVWDKLNKEDKCKVITQVIEIMCELKKHKFSKIGGIYIDPDTQEFTVGEAIEATFFSEGRKELNINRGPFDNTYDYVIAAIKKEIKYRKTVFTQENQEKWIPVYEMLADLVPIFFSKDDKEQFVLTHGDLHPTNIMVEGTKITGIIDWECSGTYPLNFFCEYPIWITNNPFASTTEEETKEHEEFQKFFREQMKNWDPEFVDIMDNMDEFKSKIYDLAFIRYLEAGRILEFLENLNLIQDHM